MQRDGRALSVLYLYINQEPTFEYQTPVTINKNLWIAHVDMVTYCEILGG